MVNSIGILAYGSLINDPGRELEKVIVTVLDTKTPFGIEYGRKSNTRGGAPTMVISPNGGLNVSAKILLIDSGIGLQMTKDMLYRREINIFDQGKKYVEPRGNSIRMRIRSLSNFQNIGTVIYADPPPNIDIVTPETLASLAIASVLTDAGEQKRDGISYLKSNISNGIITPLTQEYVNEILMQTKTNSLEEALEALRLARIKLKAK